MDLITQGLLGAAVAQSGSKQAETKIATLIGFLAGMLADADVLIYSAQDSLLSIEYHRHFSHALLFIPVGALIAAVLLWPFMKKRLVFSRLYYYCFLGYLLSGTLDAFTSYGTYLYWPFSNERVAWHLISIIDPIFSGILILSIVVGFKLKAVKVARVGLLLCVSYLTISAWQLDRAETFVRQLATQRGHHIERLVVKPSLGNIILWRSTYVSNDTIYIDAVRVGWSKIKHYAGSHIARLHQDEIKKTFKDGSVLVKDIQRFNYFSDNYLAWHPTKNNVIGDMRYSLLPDSVEPLWGIEFDKQQGQEHVRFVTFRTNKKAERDRFFSMLKGVDVTPLLLK